jgi:hypothetical protein
VIQHGGNAVDGGESTKRRTVRLSRLIGAELTWIIALCCEDVKTSKSANQQIGKAAG